MWRTLAKSLDWSLSRSADWSFTPEQARQSDGIAGHLARVFANSGCAKSAMNALELTLIAQAIEVHTINWTPIAAAMITSAVATFAVIATSKLTWHRDAKKSLGEHLKILKACRHELSLYLGKLGILLKQAKEVAEALDRNTEFSMPCYDFYPAYLENLKLEIAKRSANDGLVAAIGNCHF